METNQRLSRCQKNGVAKLKRYPAGCVDVFSSRQATLAAADPENKIYAATVVGPSKSPKGQFICYLVRWL